MLMLQQIRSQNIPVVKILVLHCNTDLMEVFTIF